MSAWIAPRDIPAGSNYGSEIIRGIESCGALLLILSINSNASVAVMHEVERAFNKQRRIMPLKIDEVTLSKSLEFYLGSAQWIDTDNGLGVALDRVLAALSKARSSPPESGRKGSMTVPGRSGHDVDVTLDDFTARPRSPVVQWFLSLWDDKERS